MKKIFSLLILAVVCALSAQATQYITVVVSGTNKTVGFRVNNVSGTYRYSRTTTQNSASTTLTTSASGNYRTFSVASGSTNNNANKTIQISMPDGVTYLEVTSGQTYITSLRVASATNLASISLKGCTNLSTLTLGTMTALTDLDLSNTKAAAVNSVTATNCPALENFNAAGCELSNLTYAGTTLYALDVSRNSLKSLDLSACTNLDIVRCENNSSLTTLKLPSSVTTISAQNSGLTSLTGFGEGLVTLDAASNALTSLTFDGFSNLTDLDISNNHLTFRSFPGEQDKPARMRYTGNDGTYNVYEGMRPAFGSYSYPLQSRLPGFSSRSDANYAIDMSDHVLNASDVKVVNVTFENASGTQLAQAVSSADGNDYTVDNDADLYGFMNTQTQARAKFTYSLYPELTLYSGYFTVPDGVTGTIKIVDEDGSILYTKDNAFFSDATEGLPDYAKRDYTKYTIPAVPTVEGDTWTIVAGPSDDAPFAWAKTYGSAVWYYMSLGTKTNKWVTAGEQNGDPGTGYGGHALKSSYSTSDNNYQWAFVGNQYSGFKIYNKARGNGETLQDYSGWWTPPTGGVYPTVRSGESLTWVVRTNSSGTGFSLENIYGGTDKVNGGVSASCFLNDFESKGYMNYWITAVDDAQNSTGSLFNLRKASDPVSACITWVIIDADNNPIYSLTTDADLNSTVSSYPEALTTLAANRFVTLPALTSFKVNSSTVKKQVSYTWTGPFDISTTTNQVHYKLFIRNAFYITSNAMSATNEALQCTQTDGTDNQYRWMFFGDPFNGFIIRNYAKGAQALAAMNGTANGNYPTFETGGSRWIVTSCTQSGYTKPFCISLAANANCYWNQYGGVNGNEGIKYWQQNGTDDAGSAIQAFKIDEVITTVTITWNIIDANNNSKLKISTDETLGATLTEYPAAVKAYEERFVSFPSLNLAADRSKEVDIPYTWTGPFQLTTDVDNPAIYRIKSARYNYYTHAPLHAVAGEAITHTQSTLTVSKRDAWFFTGDPFDGIEIRPYANPDIYIRCANYQGGDGWSLSSDAFKFIPHSAPSITTDYWGGEEPSAACGFINSEAPAYALSEQGWSYSSADMNDKGLNFCFIALDRSTLLESGYYTIHNASNDNQSNTGNGMDYYGGSYSSIYITATSSGLAHNRTQQNTSRAFTSDQLTKTAFRLDEQENGTFIISHYDTDANANYYLSGGTAVSTDKSAAYACTITPSTNGRGETCFMIRISSAESTNLLNMDTWTSSVSAWYYDSERLLWFLDPIKLTANTLDGETYYTTAYMPFDYTVPNGVTAYTIAVEGSEAVPTPLEGGVPAGTGVLLVGNSNKVAMGYSNYSAPTIGTNKLTGSYEEIAGASPYHADKYVFSGVGSNVGFYRSSRAIPAYKAYLQAEGAGVRGFTLVFDDDHTVTGIEMLFSDDSELDNNFSWDDPTSWQNATIYDLQGRRVTQPQKGSIYIVNGRKMYCK